MNINNVDRLSIEYMELKYDVKEKFTCKEYKYKYMEYPLEINNIRNKFIEPEKMYKREFKYVEVRPANTDKTYLGLYIGDFPISVSASYQEKNKELSILPMPNPAIYVPELKKIVYGIESWWREIENPRDLQDIKEIDIESVWYVTILKALEGGNNNEQ